MASVQESLRETLSKLEQAKKVNRHLQQVIDQLSTAEKNQQDLLRQLQKEFKDIEKLEKLSVKGLFHQVLGSKEEQIEKERQEYLQVSLKYDEAKKSTDLLLYERDLLQKKVSNLPQLEAKLAGLIKMREEHLIKNDDIAGRQVLEIIKSIDAQEHFIATIHSVEHTGQDVLMVLEKMIKQLQQAKNWGQWDMSGNNRSASYMKHSAIDRARDLSYNVQHLLARFQSDLTQIYGDTDLQFHVQLESFNRFTDIFFDNLISDWIVQRKIQNALNNVLNVRDRIIRIMQSLAGEVSKAREKMADLEEQRKKIILQS